MSDEPYIEVDASTKLRYEWYRFYGLGRWTLNGHPIDAMYVPAEVLNIVAKEIERQGAEHATAAQ